MKTVRSLAFLFLAAGLTVASAQTYSFTEFASWVTPDFRNWGGGWDGVAVDRNGNVFVADFQEKTIRKITAEGAVSTLAGLAGNSAVVDGTGGAARFLDPEGVAVDASGNLFVADWSVIRKITTDGVVTTFAGGGQSSSTTSDGVGTSAKFNVVNCIAVDADGNLYVGDRANAIRKISTGGVVTTLAGSPNIPVTSGIADGTGSAARFAGPRGVAVDGSGNIFVADWAGHTIRKVTQGGVVTTLAGLGGNPGRADGTGSAARFEFPTALTIDSSGNLFVLDYGGIRKVTPAGVVATVGTAVGGCIAVDGKGNLFVVAGGAKYTLFKGPPGVALATQPQSQTVIVGDTATFSVSAAGSPPFSYQWRKNGIDLPGATAATLTVPNAGPAAAGNYSVLVRDAAGTSTISTAAILTVSTEPLFTFSTFAGVAGSSGSTDGAGSAARLNVPGSVALDAAGNLFVAELGTHLIRKIAVDGSVTKFAGTAGVSGTADGIGGAAQFNSPRGVAVDGEGNVFVADFRNNTIRKLTAAGVVTTFAGLAGSVGSDDGVGAAARFNGPTGIAVDAAGNVYVGDGGNHTIRKITAAGVVTTLAGSGGSSGSADGNGSAARFNTPQGVATDPSGNVFVADTNNNLVRKITPAGAVTSLGAAAGLRLPMGVAVDAQGNVFVADTFGNTMRKISASGVVTIIGGAAGVSGSADGIGSAARFNAPRGVAVDTSGTLFVADANNNTIRKGVPRVIAAFVIAGPQSQDIRAGASTTLAVTAVGNALSYQWKKDGTAIPGATNATYTIASMNAADMGFYSVVVTGGGTAVESPVAILTVATSSASRLSNLSTRGFVQAGSDLTVGFVIRGSGGKSLVVRAVGPTLASFGVGGALADPKLDIIPASASAAINSNDDWAGGTVLAGAFAGVGAFALPATSKDAAVLATLPAAAYSARIASSITGGAGIAIAEVYDRDAADSPARLANVSTLGFVGTGAQALVPGFVIDGPASKLLLIRAVGPGLAPFGVGGTLADPQLSVIPLGKTITVVSNDNWGVDATLASTFVTAGAFALPASSKDAAVVVRLPPGGYTVTVSGVDDTTGRALVEIYDLDP